MKAEEMKDEVRGHYGKIAREATKGCGSGCGCSSDGDVTAVMTPNYDNHDSEIVGTANLGLGCGDPVRFSGLQEGMTVLDLGSGGGIDVFLAARQVGSSGRALGLDMTDEMLERAEANRQKLNISNAFFLRGEIEDIPLPGNSVDRIISNCVINLAPEKEKVFREMYRVLKPGGAFIVSDIVTDGIVPDEYRNDPRLWAGCVSGAADRAEYLNMLRNAGFETIEVLAERPALDDGGLPFRVRSVTLKGGKNGQ